MKKPDLVALRLDLLTPHPRNPREGDVGAIVESLRALGQYRPIVAQRRAGTPEEPHVILAGNHTWEAVRVLAAEDPATWRTINVVLVDADDRTALRILTADNRTHDLGRTDDERLAVLLSEMANDDLLMGTGYSADDVDELLRLAGLMPQPGAFLDGVRDAAPPSTNPTVEGLDPGVYVTVGFTMLPSQRAIVMQAVRAAMERDGLDLQSDGIVAVSQGYLTGKGLPVE